MQDQVYIAEQALDRMPAWHTVSVKAVSSGDEAGLRGMFTRLSRESIYSRFHMPYPSVPEWMLAYFVARADRREGGESIVAVVDDVVVGHAMYVRSESGGEAEVAVVVEDGWQSKGIGRLLLTELAGRAKRRGIEMFTAEVLGENRRMIGLMGALFGEIESTVSDGAYRVRARLRSIENGPVAADAEDESSEPEASSSTAGGVRGPSGEWSEVGKRRVMSVEEVSHARELVGAAAR